METYKLDKEDKELIEKAKEIIVKSRPVNLIDTGDVGCALMTSKGNIFQGVSLGFYGKGCCAEYQAIGSMVSNGEKVIKKIVAVWYDEKNKKMKGAIPPCGICREIIHQASKKNWNTEVIISDEEKCKLKDLLPCSWGGDIEIK